MTNNQNCFCVLTDDVAAAVADAMKFGGRTTVVMRHAERPPLEFGDMTFGRNLPLTEHGARDADRLGANLSTICPGCDISFFYGESLRCQLTAKRMAQQIAGAKLADGPSPFSVANLRIWRMSTSDWLLPRPATTSTHSTRILRQGGSAVSTNSTLPPPRSSPLSPPCRGRTLAYL